MVTCHQTASAIVTICQKERQGGETEEAACILVLFLKTGEVRFDYVNNKNGLGDHSVQCVYVRGRRRRRRRWRNERISSTCFSLLYCYDYSSWIEEVKVKVTLCAWLTSILSRRTNWQTTTQLLRCVRENRERRKLSDGSLNKINWIFLTPINYFG